MSYGLAVDGGSRAGTHMAIVFMTDGRRIEMRKSAAWKILAVALAGAVVCSASFAARSHSSHGGHGGGGGRSHGGGSHGGGSHGGGHSGGGFHIGSSHGNGGGGFGGGRRSGFSGSQRSTGRGYSRGPGLFSSGHGSRDSSFGRNSFSGASRASNGRAAFAGGPGRSGFLPGNFSPNSSRSSSGPNRPPSASRNSYFSAREGNGSSRGNPSRRVLSSDVVRPSTRTAFTNRSTTSRTSVIAAHDMNRASSFGADRPPYARSQISAADRGNAHLAAISYSTANRGTSNFGNSRFGGYHSTNASFSSLGSGHFGGRPSDFGRGGGFQSRDRGYNHFGHNGFGHNRFGFGGYRHRGFGYGGLGTGRGYGGGDNDFWIFGDLFGLALDFGRFAWSPWAPLGLAGLSLLEDGIQALDNSDYQQSYSNEQQSYAPLCGTYYSEENPGCLQ
jgi:hypothetical protein